MSLDWVGPNLAPDQLVIYPAAGSVHSAGASGTRHGSQNGSQPGTSVLLHTATGIIPARVTGAQLAAMTAEVRGIAGSLGSRDIVQLERTDSSLQRAAAGRNWGGTVYVATPQLLHAYGIATAQVRPGADILSMRPGLSGLTEMQLQYGAYKSRAARAGLALPAGLLPGESGDSGDQRAAVGYVRAEHRDHRACRPPAPPVGQHGGLADPGAAAADGRSDQHCPARCGGRRPDRGDARQYPGVIQISAATAFGILLALGILAMSVGLLRSETGSDLRILTAAGAGSAARRAISATTAGALALIGAVVGIVAGYIAVIGFFRASQLETLSSLSSIPVANLLFIGVGMPLIAVAGGWLLAGREPGVIGRRPL